MQRTAVQASPDMLTAIGGRWVTGARRTDDGVHPFRKSLAELRIGDSVTAGPRPVTLEDIEHFAEFTGDTFYAHMDEEAAAANPLFGGRVAHGYLIVSWAAGLFVDPDPGPVLANYGVDNLRFLTPVKPGEELTVTLTAKQISPRGGAEHGEVRWDAVVVNTEGKPGGHLRRADDGRQDLAAGGLTEGAPARPRIRSRVGRLEERGLGRASSSPEVLVPVHVGIGRAQELFGHRVAVGVHGHAHAGPDPDAARLEREGLVEAAEQPVGQCGRVVVARHAREEDGELVPAEPADGVVGTDRRAEPLRHLPQQLVARRVPQGVVDLLEPVEVAEEDGHVLLGSRRGESCLQSLEEQHPVGQSGQRVVRGPVTHGLEEPCLLQRRGGLVGDTTEPGQHVAEQGRGLRRPPARRGDAEDAVVGHQRHDHGVGQPQLAAGGPRPPGCSRAR